MSQKITTLAIVTPVYNEEQVIPHFYERISRVMNSLEDGGRIEIRLIYVLDRSRDNSLVLLTNIAALDSRVSVIALSSRFGHQMSLLAGIEHVKDCDALVMLDCDLQHPPELIPELLAHYLRGTDVVYTIRKGTEKINLIRKWAGDAFYKLLSSISSVPIYPNAADFRLISRIVAQTLCDDFHERRMFLRGLFTWIGFQQVAIEFVAEERFAGASKYSLSKMLQLASSGILSFSTKPLHVGILVGISFSLLALIWIIFVLLSFIFDQSIPSGWTTVVILLLLFGGVQLIVIGIIGAYIGGIYDEVKGRPRYIIERLIGK
jgi:dolichol-phosphate mannosyltransferase